jgi:Tfp pilus assembly protein PilF
VRPAALCAALALAWLAGPARADAWADAGALLSRGQAAAAVKAYQALGPQASHRREAWRQNNWGLALLRENKPAAAVERFEAAIQSDPRNFIARGNLAAAYERVGDRVKARDVYIRALELLREEDKALSSGRKGPAAEAEARTDLAQTSLTESAQVEKASTLKGPELKKALRDAADLLDAGRYAEAAQAYAAIGQTVPARREGWRLSNWGLCALRMGDPALARERLRRAVEADPDNTVAWGNLAVACEGLGLADEARQAWVRSGSAGGEDDVDPMRFVLARLKLDLAAERRRWEALSR